MVYHFFLAKPFVDTKSINHPPINTWIASTGVFLMFYWVFVKTLTSLFDLESISSLDVAPADLSTLVSTFWIYIR